MIKLVEPEEKYLSDYKEAYELSLKKIKDGIIKKHDLMFGDVENIDIIQRAKDDKDKSKLPNGYVPQYDYFVVEGDRLLGVIYIRISLTSSLLNFGGNIGYGTHPKYWKQGYGTEILRLGLKKARELGLREVLITCDDDNIGSYKIIEKNGGLLENKVMNESCGEKFLTRRYWIR